MSRMCRDQYQSVFVKRTTVFTIERISMYKTDLQRPFTLLGPKTNQNSRSFERFYITINVIPKSDKDLKVN